MPIFEYVCRECQTRFELLRSASSVESAECPSCGSKNSQKVISAFASQIAGSSGSSSSSGCGCGGGSGFS